MHIDAPLDTLPPTSVSSGILGAMEKTKPAAVDKSLPQYEEESALVEEDRNPVVSGKRRIPSLRSTELDHCYIRRQRKRLISLGQVEVPARGMVSNVLEVWADFLALFALHHKIRGKPVSLQMDNRAAFASIQHQEETHSSSLLKEVEPIMSLAESHLQAP